MTRSSQPTTMAALELTITTNTHTPTGQNKVILTPFSRATPAELPSAIRSPFATATSAVTYTVNQAIARNTHNSQPNQIPIIARTDYDLASEPSNDWGLLRTLITNPRSR